MNCKKTRKRLNAFLDGELSAELKARVEDHFRRCPECAAELARLRKLRGLLDQVPGMTVPAGFARSVRAGAERLVREEKLVPMPAARSLVLVRVAAMVAIVVGLALGGVVSNAVVRARSVESPVAAAQEPDLLSVVPPGSLAEVCVQWFDETGTGAQ